MPVPAVVSRRLLFITLPILIIIVAFTLSPSSSQLLVRRLANSFTLTKSIFSPKGLNSTSSAIANISTKSAPTLHMTKTPVYFFSHGGPNVQYETKHPVYPILQSIGREITQKVKPKAVVVFSAHWQATPNEIHLNNAEKTDLIYDFYGFPPEYYTATFPSVGSPSLASKIQSLLTAHSIPSKGLKRGLDHGVFSGFNVAFSPETNPLNVPLVQVSLFENESPQAHFALGRAVSSLREEGIVIICTGMTVHNLRDLRSSWGNPIPKPYTVSFDNALKEAVESDPGVREEKMSEAAKRPDARQAHPWMDHLMPLYVAAGAAGDDWGKQTWTLHEGCMGWGQYRFGDLPSE